MEKNMENQYLGVIAILLKAREKSSFEINKILTEASNIIVARMGVNIEPRCSTECLGLICVSVKGDKVQIEELEQKLIATGACETGKTLFAA